MIEPGGPKAGVAVRDEITAGFRSVFNAALAIEQPWGGGYRGFHICGCGEMSGNHDIRLPSGHLTNSLAMHYLEFHRDDVPAEEIIKLIELPLASPEEIAQRVLRNKSGYDSEDHELPPKPETPRIRPLSSTDNACREFLSRWCLAGACACAGCANGFFRSQEEWVKWVGVSGGRMVDDTQADISNIKIPGTVKFYPHDEAGMAPLQTVLEIRKAFDVDLPTARRYCLKGTLFEVEDPEIFTDEMQANGFNVSIASRTLPNYVEETKLNSTI